MKKKRTSAYPLVAGVCLESHKLRYASRLDALLNTSRLPGVRAWECGACGGWHVTSSRIT